MPVALGVVAVTGALSFAARAVLVSSRAENTQTVSGLMNVVMMPMFVLSGVFFSAAHFPELMQPLISILPLTALNDALRAVMIDGASAGGQRTLGVLAGWGIASFAVGVRIFRQGDDGCSPGTARGRSRGDSGVDLSEVRMSETARDPARAGLGLPLDAEGHGWCRSWRWLSALSWTSATWDKSELVRMLLDRRWSPASTC